MFFKKEGNELIQANAIFLPEGITELPSGWVEAETSDEALAKIDAGSISLAQFHAGLKIAGIYDTAVAMLEAMPEGVEKIVASERFYRAESVLIDNPLIVGMGAQMGLTQEQIAGYFAMWKQI